ncbi:hypothetical protein M3Y99_01398200 [Aphelenchoides fujianensis]|nr:hypothetical protein M3Y99_01398200 [Aphelenchoides fujianensis]
MPYVNSNGEVVDNTPFSFYKFLFEIYLAFVMFWKTLLAPLTGATFNDPDSADRYRDTLRGTGGNNRRGGGGGGGGGRRPIGRLNNTSTSMPSCASGGCCG